MRAGLRVFEEASRNEMNEFRKGVRMDIEKCDKKASSKIGDLNKDLMTLVEATRLYGF